MARWDGLSSLELAPGVWAAADAVRLQFARSSGPGGQNVNKLNTKAELWVEISALTGMPEAAKLRLIALAGAMVTAAGEIHVTSDTHRSQERNRGNVLEKLRRLVLAAMVKPKPRHKTRPTAGSRRRRLEQKRHRGEIKVRRRDGGEE
jgi:ribosome-associated protein